MLYDKTYKVKKQVTDWKKTFAETIDKRIAFRIYKPPKTTDKKKQILQQKMGKGFEKGLRGKRAIRLNFCVKLKKSK